MRTRFDGHWASGFELIGTQTYDDGDRYLVRRCSDHTVLPTTFGPEEIRWPTGLIADVTSSENTSREETP